MAAPQPRASSLRVAAGASLGMALALAGCRAPEPPEVIAADGVLCDITQRLAATDLRVSCLLQPGEDPHQFRLTPQQSRELSQAPLVLINGYGLTPALANHPGALAVAEQAVPNSPQLTDPPPDPHPQHDGHHADEPSEAHNHGDRDPHVWHDPSQASAMVQLVARQLEQLKPAAKGRIAARAQQMTTLLRQLDEWNRQQLASIPTAKPLASGHRAFASLARAYGLEELPLVDGMSSSDSLRPQAFQAVLADLQKTKVPMLFAEQQPASKALQRISSLSGIPLAPAPLVADGLAKARAGSDSSTLMTTLTANTCLIVDSLGGRCNQASGKSLAQRWQAIR
jgi:ABC-type Zn uptake system ZnuABC Zn-binding protein ZnuA